ncbi:MAG: formimidoylglutamate deiminase [Acidimicrobiales bacterium]|nr:formimidoylglutamate deiminase [Acidimicrobiales bacterium]
MAETSARRVWCERALLADGVGEGVTIDIADGMITAVADRTDAAGAERLAGLTVPGFANAHSHAFHRALRGRTHGGPGDFWSWREQMYAVASRLTPDNYRDLATATFAEMLLAGYTSVGEFHYVHHQPDGTPYADPNAMGLAIIDAARATGIRLTLLDACYLRSGARQPVLAEQARFSDGTAAAWAERVELLTDDAMTRIGAAVHSVRAVDAESIGVVAEHARRRSMPLHAHVSEQLAENEQVFEEYECTPTELLARQGALNEHFTAVHATHLQQIDIDLLAARRCVCCFCPTTERDLADGIGPSSGLRTAGVRLSIGSDQHVAIDPFEEMRGIEMDERLRSRRRGTHPASELITAGTSHGYASLGWPAGGRIAVGALADLTTIGLDSVRLAGCDRRADALLDAVVFAAAAADVSDVIVGGRTVVRAGKHVSIDVADALERSIRAVTDGAPA